MSSKRQTTMAKLMRERKVQERRELKQEKKRAAAAERKAREAGELPPEDEFSPGEEPGEELPPDEERPQQAVAD